MSKPKFEDMERWEVEKLATKLRRKNRERKIRIEELEEEAYRNYDEIGKWREQAGQNLTKRVTMERILMAYGFKKTAEGWVHETWEYQELFKKPEPPVVKGTMPLYEK